MLSAGRYWIAINGASCARYPGPLRDPFIVLPKPQLLVGFKTAQQSAVAQNQCLFAKPDDLRETIRGWFESDDVIIRVMDKPQSPTDGETVWSEL